MPKLLNLAGQRFGLLTAVRVLEKRDNCGKSFWLCRCDCGKEISPRTAFLRTGKRTSCGCVSHPWTKTEAADQLKATERIVDDQGVAWLSLRAAAKRAGVTKGTISQWAVCCDRLGGEGITTKKFRAFFGREVTYFLEEDFDRIEAALKALKPAPEYPDLVYIGDAAAECGINKLQFAKLRRKMGGTTESRWGKDVNGLLRKRFYVTRSFVDACKTELAARQIPKGKIAVEKAARLLKTSREDVRNLIPFGLLESETRSVMVFDGIRKTRRMCFVSRAQVDQLRKALAKLRRRHGADPGGKVRIGRPMGELRLAAESIRDDLLRAATRKGAPEAAGQSPQGGDGASTPAPNAMHLRVEPFTSVTALRPRWNADRRELLYNGVVCARYTKQAPYQETILAGFEELGWPERVDDPLPHGKLRSTLWLLMAKVKASPIRFSSDGSGRGIRWSIRPI